jgi:proteic killer suppression protein
LLSKLPLGIQKVALRKLMMLDKAQDINDLRMPPANHLEKLSFDRLGQYSIIINRQYRICFTINEQNDIENVEIVDYHN